MTTLFFSRSNTPWTHKEVLGLWHQICSESVFMGRSGAAAEVAFCNDLYCKECIEWTKRLRPMGNYMLTLPVFPAKWIFGNHLMISRTGADWGRMGSHGNIFVMGSPASMKCQQGTTLLASVWLLNCRGFEVPSLLVVFFLLSPPTHLCHNISVGICLLLINFSVHGFCWTWMQIGKDNRKLSLGLPFASSLRHVGVKMDRNCLSLFSVIYLTPLAFIRLIGFFPSLPTQFEVAAFSSPALAHKMHTPRERTWSFASLLCCWWIQQDAFCLFGGFPISIAWGKINYGLFFPPPHPQIFVFKHCLRSFAFCFWRKPFWDQQRCNGAVSE